MATKTAPITPHGMYFPSTLVLLFGGIVLKRMHGEGGRLKEGTGLPRFTWNDGC